MSWTRVTRTVVQTRFSFDGYAGDKPHARVWIAWTNVEALIAKFAEDGHPAALRLKRAERFADAVREVEQGFGLKTSDWKGRLSP